MAHPDAFDLMVHRWRRRLLLIFSPSPSEAAYAEQLRLFAGRSGDLAERDLLLVHLFADAARLGDTPLPSGTAGTLRADFDVDADAFAVVLIGLDGTEKRRSTHPVPPEDIFEAIDAMPRRQGERRRRREPC